MGWARLRGTQGVLYEPGGLAEMAMKLCDDGASAVGLRYVVLCVLL